MKKQVFYEDLDCIKAMDRIDLFSVIMTAFMFLGCVVLSIFVEQTYIILFIFTITLYISFKFYKEKRSIRVYPKENTPSLVIDKNGIMLYGKKIQWKNIKKTQITWSGSYERSYFFHCFFIKKFSCGTCQRLYIYTSQKKEAYVLDLGENFHKKDRDTILSLIQTYAKKLKFQN